MRCLRAYLRSPSAMLGLALLLGVLVLSAAAGTLFPGNPLSLAGRPLQWPFANSDFVLGTDQVGRNIAAQIFHGARVTLFTGLAATLISLGLGVVLGALSGYFGGWTDELLMRLTEAFQILPNFLLLLLAVAVFGSKLPTIIVAIGLVSWPPVARLTRAEFMSLRHREFVLAGRTLGMGHSRLIFGEILPNALPPVIVYASVVLAGAILLESALAFLNLSDPNYPSWGNLIGGGRLVLRSEWYVSAIPGLAILLTVLAVSLVGQGLNDALNPRLQQI